MPKCHIVGNHMSQLKYFDGSKSCIVTDTEARNVFLVVLASLSSRIKKKMRKNRNF